MNRLAALRSALVRLRRRTRTGIVLEAAAVAATLLLLFALVSYALDRTLRLEVGYRAALLVLLAAGLAHVAYWRLWCPLRAALTDDEMALAVERATPSLRQSLISALQFDRALTAGSAGLDSPALMAKAIDEAKLRCANTAFGTAIDGARVRRFGALLALTLAAGSTGVALAPGTAKLWAARNLGLADLDWPPATRLMIAGSSPDGVLRVARGDDVTLAVRAEGEVPDLVWLHSTFTGGEPFRTAMQQITSHEFAYTLPALLEDATCYAQGGDGTSPKVRLQVVPRPVVLDLRARVALPEYLQRAVNDVDSDPSDLTVLRGGEVTLQARSTKPLRSATLTFSQGRRQDLTIAGDGLTLSGRWLPTVTGAVTLHVLDHDQLDCAQPPRLHVRVVEDLVPQGQFVPRGVGAMLTAQARIPGQLTLTDDFGLRSVRAEWQISASAATAAKGAFTPAQPSGLDALRPGTTELVTEVVFDLQAHSAGPEAPTLQPGVFAALRFVAEDDFPPGEPHAGTTDPVVFRIVTRDHLLEDLTRRQSEQRAELQRVIEHLVGTRAEVSQMVSPTGSDPRAATAKQRGLALSRDQQTQGLRVATIATTYDRILDEYLNNRVLDVGVAAELHQQIVVPLADIAAHGFPAAGTAVAAFAAQGSEQARELASAALDRIVTSLKLVLSHMTETETFAALLEDLRATIQLQRAAMQEAEKQRARDAGSLFEPVKHQTPNHDRDK